MVNCNATRSDGRRGGDGRLIGDAYTRRARLAPAALAAAPAIVLAGGALTAIEQAGGIIAFVLGAGAVVVCGLVRGLGRALEPSLWAEWGGPPTTQRLRWNGSTPKGAQQRRRNLLERLLSESLPSEAEENADPSEADRRYEIAVAALRDLTRDASRFNLVAEENAEYGFRRNCLGLRPLAVVVALLVLAVSGGLILVASRGQFFIPLGVAVLSLVFWLGIVRASWVRSAADRYAVRLLETVESLSQPGL